MTANSGIAGGLSMSKIGTIKVRELYLNGDPSKNLLSSYAQSKKEEPEQKEIKKTRRSIELTKNRNQNAAKRTKSSHNSTANFERLSGLITEAVSDEKKARLIAHFKKIKQA